MRANAGVSFVVSLVALVVATSCRGPAASVVPDAAAATAKAQTWRFAEHTRISGHYFTTEGTVDTVNHQSRLIVTDTDTNAVGEIIEIGEVTYLGKAFSEHGLKGWTKTQSCSGNGPFAGEAFPITDPMETLRSLKEGSSSFAPIGERDDDSGRTLTGYRAEIAIAGATGMWEVWIGDGFIRRIEFGDSDGSYRSRLELYAFGEEVSISAPDREAVPPTNTETCDIGG